MTSFNFSMELVSQILSVRDTTGKHDYLNYFLTFFWSLITIFCHCMDTIYIWKRDPVCEDRTIQYKRYPS